MHDLNGLHACMQIVEKNHTAVLTTQSILFPFSGVSQL